jgi:hypothetical protein
MRAALRRAVRITFWPSDEWLVIREEIPGQMALLTGFILPLCFIPAACWSMGLALFAGRGVVAADDPNFAQIVQGGLTALLGSVASVLLIAVSLYLLVPLFAKSRNWARSLQVAAYSSAPAFLAGVLLILPDLVFGLMIAAVHCFYLQYLGVQAVLGVKSGDAAECVALVIVLFILASTLLGSVGSQVGVM